MTEQEHKTKFDEIDVRPTEDEMYVMEAMAVLEPINEADWCTGVENDDHGRHCMIGHLKAKGLVRLSPA